MYSAYPDLFQSLHKYLSDIVCFIKSLFLCKEFIQF